MRLRGKAPTRKQKEIIKLNGLQVKKYLVLSETDHYVRIIQKGTRRVRIIPKKEALYVTR